MLLLCGSSPFPRSRQEYLLQAVMKEAPEVTGFSAAYLHMVNCVSETSEELITKATSTERQVLDTLLGYGQVVDIKARVTLEAFPTQNALYIVPRPGSISPWSSKATDISKMCNLNHVVNRLERGLAVHFATDQGTTLSSEQLQLISTHFHDRMTQIALEGPPHADSVFKQATPSPLQTIKLIDSGFNSEEARRRLTLANAQYGLALAEDEINYLLNAYIEGPGALKRDPTDAELFMFAQVNSEHCRHKIFNAGWTIDGVPQDLSLFQMIRNTELLNGSTTISAYSDNAAVLEGSSAPRFAASPCQGQVVYSAIQEEMPILIKVETHNHPTAVSPYPGAATGSGGEIRDEGAVGRGSKPKAGLSGFTVSNLLIPEYPQPWESDFGRPSHIASALDIMLEGPLGASAFNNEFGRPGLSGYFRTFAERVPSALQGPDGHPLFEVRGYHKPIMVAGGMGNVRPAFAKKQGFSAGAKIVVLGGPGMLIGLGGGAASSQASGSSSADLDFASVQRENAEMQRRCQQVIDSCVSLAESNPILSIHDVGAGGLSNALPELVHDAGLGGRFEIRDILVADHSMSPMEIWCNESQERYVLAIAHQAIDVFEAIAKRERCPYSVAGEATEVQELVVSDRLLGTDAVKIPMPTLFGKPPKLNRSDHTLAPAFIPFDSSLSTYLPLSFSLQDCLADAIGRVLRIPAVGSKGFLITIGDRSVTGLVTRDQMVGPWQVPVADVAVTRSSYGFDVTSGEAMAMGERTPVALINSASSARLAVAESLTNLAAASIRSISQVKLSANWMCAATHPGEGARLYEAVRALGMDLCPTLGVGIPVGKDSMSMSMRWKEADEDRKVIAPMSLIVTAFAPVEDVSLTWTPQLQRTEQPTVLVLIDLAQGKQRLGGSSLAQVYKQLGSDPPDVEDPEVLKSFFTACQTLKSKHGNIVLAYHDRSDGGLITTVVEMAFAGRVGVDLSVNAIPTVSAIPDVISSLFAEELGAVVQVRESDLAELTTIFSQHGFPTTALHVVGKVNTKSHNQTIRLLHNSDLLFTSTRGALQSMWVETSYRMQSIRDEPSCAKEEFELIKEPYEGLSYHFNFTAASPIPPEITLIRPKIAILREQGVNGHVEMAWAFSAAGFQAVDVHMSDILSKGVSLSEFRGIAACGGFSYGDVLGAGSGWAKSILLHDAAKEEFAAFFSRTDTFALAVCNGCQLFSHLKSIIPGASSWPSFNVNKSQRFEGRVCMVEVVPGPVSSTSVFLRDMVGARLPVAVAHGEGRACFATTEQKSALFGDGLVGVRYVGGDGLPTERYPLNPNGSPDGITGVQTPDGRILALMPHPERVVTAESNSWYPHTQKSEWSGIGPWFQMFKSARVWCG